MVKEYVNRVLKHKHALCFAAGVATVIVGKKIIESNAFKDAATQGMATVMSARKGVEEAFQDIKENAEDIVVDANEETKKEIYVSDDE